MSLTARGGSSIHLLWLSIYWPFSASVLHTLKFWLVLVNVRIYTYARYLLLKCDGLQTPKVMCPISSKQPSLHPALHLSQNWHLEIDSFLNFLLQIIHKSLFWFHTGSSLCFQPLLTIFCLWSHSAKIIHKKNIKKKKFLVFFGIAVSACVPQNWDK